MYVLLVMHCYVVLSVVVLLGECMHVCLDCQCTWKPVGAVLAHYSTPAVTSRCLQYSHGVLVQCTNPAVRWLCVQQMPLKCAAAHACAAQYQ
jgi:hypothetical protein